MSKKLTRKQQERQKKRASKKTAMREQYKAWADAGRTKGSFRARKKAKSSKKVRNLRHVSGPCGNIGCKHCHPETQEAIARAKKSNSEVAAHVAAALMA